MANSDNNPLLGKLSGINFQAVKRLKAILPLLKDNNDDGEVREKLQDAIDFISSVEAFAFSKSTPVSPLLTYVITAASKLDFQALHGEGKLMADDLANVNNLAMITANGQVQLLQFLIRQVKAKNILEVGGYIGYSAFGMAEAMAPGGKVTTIEIEPFFCKFINDTAKERNVNIQVKEGAALSVLSALAKKGEKYDFIYIDCVKYEYSDYYKIIMDNSMLNREGILAADNVIYSGQAIAQKDRDGIALDAFSSMVAEDKNVRSMMLPCFDGLLLVQHNIPS